MRHSLTEASSLEYDILYNSNLTSFKFPIYFLNPSAFGVFIVCILD